MSMLKNLTTDDSIQNERDSVGGGGAVETDLYAATIEYAYTSKAKSEAIALNLSFKLADGKNVRSTLWMTSGKDKGCKNYYEDKAGAKQYLPGFNQANAIALLTVGKEISELETETKTIKLYSYEAKKEVPTQVEMVMDLVGQEILVGIQKQTVDKTAKDGNGDYQPTGETREENELDKVFRAKDRMTVAEIRSQAETAEFADQWVEKFKGKTRNRAKGAAGGTAGSPKSGASASGAGTTAKPSKSLFG